MHRFKVMLALFLVAFGGVSLASAAGVGTFSFEQTAASVGVGQFGIATLYMDSTWQPPADSGTLTISWDPAIIQYVSTDWKIGNSVAATPVSSSELTLSFADYTKKYANGRIPIAALNFKGLAAGQTTLGVRVDSIRSHVGISETDFTDLTVSAVANPGIFTVGQGGGVVTPVTTAPVGTTLTVPTLTIGTGTTVPVVPTVPGNVTGTITTIATLVPTTGITTGISTGVPFVPTQGVSSGSDEYTGVLTRTPTVTATRTATVSATVTANATTGAGNATVTATTVRPAVNNTTANATANATATLTASATTPARTTVPVNTTATRAGADVLPLAVAGIAALALFVVRRR